MRRIGAGNNPMVGMTVAVENLKTDTSFKALPVMCLFYSTNKQPPLLVSDGFLR